MEISHIPHSPTHAEPLPLSTLLIRMVHLLPRINLHRHIIVTQIDYAIFTFRFTISVVQPVGLDTV